MAEDITSQFASYNKSLLTKISDLDSDNRIRPNTIGSEEHDDPIATIILFTNTDKTNETYKNIDYLNDLSSYVQPLISGSIDNTVMGSPESVNGNVAMLSMNSKNDYYGVFNNFSVTGLTESHDQITKVHMNFSARWNVFFFGNTPNIYQVRGVFLDTMEYPYYQEFLVAYEKYLSGRKCVENAMQTKLMISGQIIDGFLLNVSVTHNATTPTLKEFTFTMLVKGSSWVRINRTHSGEAYQRTPNKEVFNGLSNLNRIGYTG